MGDNPRCPKCGEEVDDESLYLHHVAYWGESGPIEFWCNCDHKFLITEYVSRWYEVSEIEE